MSIEERIIVALDCPKDKALSLARELKGNAVWLKVGMTLYYAEGPSIVKELKGMGYKVFVDLKFFDIPNQVRGAAASVVDAGADMLTVHGLGGLPMMHAAAEGVRQAYERRVEKGSKPLALAITVVTSMDGETLLQVGVERTVTEQVNSLALLAMQAGLDGVVASPLEAKCLRGLLEENTTIVTPGVRPTGSSQDDQSRFATPAQAILDGASHLVIGRPITEAKSPIEAFRSIVDEIRR